MKLLLDTHAILWALSGDSRLSARAKRHYEGSEDLAFSVVSLWEIGIKLGLRRTDFELSEDWWEMIPRTLVGQGAKRLEISDGHCRDVAKLPLHHRDPFDRMLIVQAQAQQRTLLSCDEQFDYYGVKRIW